MRLTVDVDDGFILQALKKDRDDLFEEVISIVKSDTYPKRMNIGDLEDCIKYINAINQTIEFYGGDTRSLVELFDHYKAKNFMVPLDD